MVFGNYNTWRTHPMVNPKLSQGFPGFKWAVGIFAVYCSCEWVYVDRVYSLICRYNRFAKKPKAIKHTEEF